MTESEWWAALHHTQNRRNWPFNIPQVHKTQYLSLLFPLESSAILYMRYHHYCQETAFTNTSRRVVKKGRAGCTLRWSHPTVGLSVFPYHQFPLFFRCSFVFSSVYCSLFSVFLSGLFLLSVVLLFVFSRVYNLQLDHFAER